MTTWANAPQEGKKFWNLSIGEAAKISFEQASIKETENFIQVFCKVTELSDLAAAKDKPKPEFPFLGSFRLVRKDFENNGKKYAASPASAFYAEMIVSGGMTCFKGSFDLSAPKAMVEAMSTYIPTGNAAMDAQMNTMFAAYIVVEEDELKDYALSDVPDVKTGGYGKGSYTPAQKEGEKLQDRLLFLGSPDLQQKITDISASLQIPELELIKLIMGIS
jgi:hypothetical protein